MGGFPQVLRENQIRILEYLYGRPKQMARLDDVVVDLQFKNRGHIYNSVRGLIGKGYIRQVSRGLYELAGRGRRYVEEMG
jgi:hypothetical protein